MARLCLAPVHKAMRTAGDKVVVEQSLVLPKKVQASCCALTPAALSGTA